MFKDRTHAPNHFKLRADDEHEYLQLDSGFKDY